MCAWPEELEQLHFDLKKLPDYEQIKKEFKSIASSKENNYIVNTLFKRMPREAKLMIYQQTEQNVCPYCNRNFIENLKVAKNKKVKKMLELLS